MEYKKRFSTVRELLDSEEFKNKDLSYCDLSNLDLRSMKPQTWKGFKFFHTNFRTTGIVFEPLSLWVNEHNHFCMEYCDFTGCDLSYIRGLQYVSFKGCKFKNTHLSTKLFIDSYEDIKDVIFSEEMTEEIRWWVLNMENVDMSVLELNPHIPFGSLEILLLLKRSLPALNSFIPSSKYESYIALIDKALEEDSKREGALVRLYNLLAGDNFSPIDKIQFFMGLVHDKSYDKIDFSSIPYELLEKIIFRNCRFDEVTLPDEKLSNMSIIDEDVKNIIHTTVPHLIIAGLDASSWQVKRSTRIGNTCFTRQTNLYLELGRKCNAKCAFCRNHLLKDCKFDFGAIMKSFRSIEPYLNNVVIGGGEPTLYQMRDYLQKIMETRKKYGINYSVFTNGSGNVEYLKELARVHDYRINLSRHAIEDADNDKIFGISTLSTEQIRDLNSNIYINYLTLVATCFNEGLNSVEAIERYIELSDYLHVNSVLFQSLHEDLEGFTDQERALHQIDDMLFDEVIAKLREQGYFVSELPIYSTGDYKLIIVKSSDNEKTISFKKYITKEELEREWHRASKRTFDLSLAPNGDLFQNWHQSSDKVLCILPKRDNKRL